MPGRQIIKHYYLVDLENVGLQGLCGLNLPGKGSAIVLFLSNAAHTGTSEIEKDILNSEAEFSTFFCSIQGKNAMDFELSAYFGAVLEKPETERVSIISQDGGYKSLMDYAAKVRKKVQVYMGRNLLEAYVAAQNMAGPKMYAKGQHVDFKHIMESLDKKRSFESPLREKLEEKLSEEEMRTVLDIAGSEMGLREKYLALIKLLGKKNGTEIYREIKER